MHKQCRSLAAEGYDVTLVLADGKGEDVIDRVRLRDVGRGQGRFARMALSAYRVFREGQRLDADLYHLHDPELIPWGLILRAQGKRVVFDAHESLPEQVRTKFYIPSFIRGPLSRAIILAEGAAFPRFSALVGATNAITNRLSKLGPPARLVANYPLRDEFKPIEDRNPQYVLFVGSISRIRGLRPLVDAMALVRSDRRLRLVGPMANDGIAQDVAASPGFDKTEVVGPLSRPAVAGEMKRALCGVVTFLEAPNHISSEPNKMFEYMSAGLPVIASNFSLWRRLIEETGSGICVDPADPRAIADAIDFLAGNPGKAREMGESGRRTIEARLNWEAQARTLTDLYCELGVVP